MVEPLSGLVEGEMAEVVWIISEADVREMLGRSGFLYGEVLTCLLKNPARQCVYTEYAGGWWLYGRNIQKKYLYGGCYENRRL